MYFCYFLLFKNKSISQLLKSTLVIGIIVSNSFAYGQQVIWANKNNLDKKTDFTKIIGQNKHGVYALKHKNSSFKKYFILERFDKKMNLLQSKTIKIPNAELQKIIVMSDDIIFFTKVFEKDYQYSLTMQHLDSNLNLDAPVNLLSHCSFINSASDFKIEYSQNKERLLAWYLNNVENTAYLHLVSLINGKISVQHDISMNVPFNDIEISKTLLDLNGNFHMIYVVSKNFKSPKAFDYSNYLMCIDMQSGRLTKNSLSDQETFISNSDLSYNSNTGKLRATGFYGKKDEEDNLGFFDITVNASDFKIEHNVFSPIDRKTVAAIIGAKYEQKGENLNKFRIRKTVPKMDGGCLIIAEKSFITTQSDVFYVNGMPQTSYAKIFNNDELLLLSLDSSGKLQWTETVIKNQSSINDGGYFNGIVIMVNEKTVSIIYNDRLSANADIMQITYSENGEHTKKILLNSDQYYALVIPAEYCQVTANSIVLPINQNRDYTYIKLVY